MDKLGSRIPDTMKGFSALAQAATPPMQSQPTSSFSSNPVAA
ncbi:hypothetical protein GA0061098_102266 [Bradyrhizobium shewense]|uniref:Uncharacterized protein n=1 Tax=Bradyrhizobium shewense TaxID=1761772 RepID=A0A1C3XP10_9BRAD|nr:hypothetical protein [Bradyrhizobium shewense]SCB53987.1 hypothetical protein GA0061098_102266 [Bradyrhizobium shewense]